MSKKQVVLGAAVASLIISALIGLFMPYISSGDIGAKTAFIIALACVPVFFVVLLFAIPAANKKNRKNVELGEKIKMKAEEINAVQDRPQLYALQTEFAQLLAGAPSVVIDLRTSDILSALSKQVPGSPEIAPGDPLISRRNDAMASWLASRLGAMIVSTHRIGNIGDFGRAAHVFGGYPFMRQVVERMRTDLDQQSQQLIIGTLDQSWDEIEDWKHNKQ